MSRRSLNFGSQSFLVRTVGDGTDYTSGPKGDTGDIGDNGATGPTGATGPSSYVIIYSADFTDGISGSTGTTGASGATGAFTVTDDCTSGDIWFPQSVIFYQDAASDETNEHSTAEIYVDDISITETSTLSKLTGSGTYQQVICDGGPVVTDDSSVHAKVVGEFSKVKIYIYGSKNS